MPTSEENCEKQIARLRLIIEFAELLTTIHRFNLISAEDLSGSIKELNDTVHILVAECIEHLKGEE